MKRNALMTAVIAALTLGAGANAFAQNIVMNPGFESGTTGWTFTGNVAVQTYATYNGFGGNGNIPAYGTSFAAFNSTANSPLDGVISQTLNTAVGGTYRVNFLYGDFNLNSNNGASSQSIIASALSGITVLNSLAITDSPSANVPNYPTVYGTPRQFTFVATSTTTTLRFADQPTSQPFQSDGILENVSVVAVPESGSLVLLLPAATLLVGCVVRRRSNR